MRPQVYILPGTLCTDLMFEQQISVLERANYEVTVVPFNAEESIASLVDLTVKTMANQPGVVIGFSMGGIVALELANHYPELITKLCLLSTNYHADTEEKRLARQAHIKQAEQNSLLSVIEHSYLPNYFYCHQQAHADIVVKMANELGLTAFKAQLNALATRKHNLSALENISKPVLILAGQQDKLCIAEYQHAMHEACRHSDLILLDRCGHFPTLERGQLVSQLLLAWLEES